MATEIIYIEMSEMDYLLISKIKELRVKNGLTQLQLTQRMKMADGFISKVETLTERAKYNIRHLPLLAKALELDVKDLLPRSTPKNDIIRLTIKRSNKINQDGSISSKMQTEIINIESIDP